MSGKYEAARKRLRLRPWQWVLLGFCVLLAAVSAVSALRFRVCRNTLASQNAAERWKGESELNFAQASVFLPEGGGVDDPALQQLRKSLDAELKTAGVQLPEDAGEDAKLYTDGYAAPSRLSVRSDRGRSADNVLTYGVGGNFFLFHPMKLLSGAYLTEDYVMKDRVVLDEGLAWALFGGSDVAGMEVTIGETVYQIAGVVQVEDDFATDAAYDEKYMLFIDYDALKAIDESAGITNYEIVMPEVFKGFAENTLTKYALSGEAELVMNSYRYDFMKLLGVIGAYGKRSMQKTRVALPFWENAARMTEDHAAFALIMALLFAVVPVICAATVLIRLLIRTIVRAKDRLVETLERRREARRTKRYVRKGI